MAQLNSMGFILDIYLDWPEGLLEASGGIKGRNSNIELLSKGHATRDSVTYDIAWLSN